MGRKRIMCWGLLRNTRWSPWRPTPKL